MVNIFKVEKAIHIIHNDINLEGYSLINFINLSSDELEMVRFWRNSDSIRKWMYNDKIISKIEHKQFIISLNQLKNKSYWLVKDKNYYIGIIYFSNIMWSHRNAYLGIYTNPEQQTPGRGTTLLSLILEIAFKFINLHSLKLEVIEGNMAALKLYKKLGFSEEGRLKEFVCKNNEWKDVIIMGIINPLERKNNENLKS